MANSGTPKTLRTAGAWDRDEVRELNNALHIALEYFNIPKDSDKRAAKELAKRARDWSVRWILQRTVKYTHDLDRLNYDIWQLSAAPRPRALRTIQGVDVLGRPAIARNTAAEVAFDANIRLCPVLTAGQKAQVIKSRKVVVLDQKFKRARPGENVSIASLQRQGIFQRLPEFIMQLGYF
ncbi:hypothetical protein VMCG_09595 [Cytospora schulzeri]|uniref:Uncharacterized protein n=1 Tax=Cytospora schulzeri TaxID=448051 RepID=A0A423VJ73_9PEZI|nr:hypothetical protein VMCG_09595 [Valsa malicola]